MAEVTEQNIGSIKNELSEVTYQLIKLYDRWAVEHQQVARREAEMTRVIEGFEKESQSLKALEETLPQTLSAAVVRSMEPVKQAVRESVQAHFEREVYGLTKALSGKIREADKLLEHYQSEQASQQLKAWAAMLLSSLLTGALVGVFVMVFVR